MKSSKQQTAYPLRIPTALRDQLDERASVNKRSLNAELLARLDASLQSSGGLNLEAATPLQRAISNVEAAQNSLNAAMEELARALTSENRVAVGETPTHEAFSCRLIRLRAIAGMSQLDLAKASGVSIAQVGRYETGISAPRHAAIAKLAKALNVSASDLA